MSSQPNPNTGGGPAAQRPATSTITPSQRAAVIITMLGESAAKPIVEKLDDLALAEVAAALENISFLARDQLAEIVIDFLTHLRSSAGALRGGKSKAREVIASVVEPNRLSLVLGEAPPETVQAIAEDDVWARLAQKDARQIAEYLGGLTPNLTALILRQLDVSVSSDILCHLDEDKLAPMMGYMVDGPQPDPGIDAVIGRMVEMEFLNREQDDTGEDDAHLEKVGELLSLIPVAKRDSLVKFLHSEHEGKLQSIQNAIFTIEGLPELLPRNAVPVVFRELETATMITLLSSLGEAHAPVAEFLLSNISSRLADQIREDLNDLKAPSPEEAETLQRDFLSALMGMKRREMITLEKPEAPPAPP